MVQGKGLQNVMLIGVLKPSVPLVSSFSEEDVLWNHQAALRTRG